MPTVTFVKLDSLFISLILIVVFTMNKIGLYKVLP